MNNPPLTAKDTAIIEDLIDTFRLDHASKQANAMQAVLLTAQQNAELVAENECLREQNLAMIDGVDELQAENERLKQQICTIKNSAVGNVNGEVVVTEDGQEFELSEFIKEGD